MPLLSVIIPVYNEAGTIKAILEKVNSVSVDKEIIVVDDCSTDGTGKILNELHYENIKIIHHGSNRGKGAAVLTGLSQAAGEYVVVQDADFEYDPNDYVRLLDTIKIQGADLVLGARFTEGYRGSLIPKAGNRLLTGILNILFGVKLNDCLTCYKLMRRQSMIDLSFESHSCDIEIEILAKAIKKGMRIAEVPVSYIPRSYAQGKTIRLIDALWAIYYIFKYRIVD